jgi:hypothetical protein
MLEHVLGRFVSGALWGVAAGVIVLLREGEGEGLRNAARRVVALGLAATERLQEVSAEARESLEDLYAEAASEHEQTSTNERTRG